jgi:hypothetical protein
MVGGYNKILLASPNVEEKSLLYMFVINIAHRQFPWHPTLVAQEVGHPTQALAFSSLYHDHNTKYHKHLH